MDEYDSEDELGDAPGSSTRPKKSTPKPATVSSPVKHVHKSPVKQPGVKAKPKVDDAGKYLDMKDYLDAMDRELSSTTIGKSFVREGDNVDKVETTLSVHRTSFSIYSFFSVFLSFKFVVGTISCSLVVGSLIYIIDIFMRVIRGAK